MGGQQMRESDQGPRRRRGYIRHPVEIPLAVNAHAWEQPATAHDLGHGGIRFLAAGMVEPGTWLTLSFSSLDGAPQVHARVIWCQAVEGDGYEVGAAFPAEADRMRARMMEQVVAIERYRERVEREEGRVLAPEEAAREWVNRNAGKFPT